MEDSKERNNSCHQESGCQATWWLGWPRKARLAQWMERCFSHTKRQGRIAFSSQWQAPGPVGLPRQHLGWCSTLTALTRQGKGPSSCYAGNWCVSGTVQIPKEAHPEDKSENMGLEQRKLFLHQAMSPVQTTELFISR